MKKNYLLILVLISLLYACTSQAIKDEEIIQDYIADNNIQAIRHNSGIYYSITDSLDTLQTEFPNLKSTVYVIYKGYFIDGTIFDKTKDNDTNIFPLNRLITGWQYGIQLMNKGDKALFFIPSELGYGDKDYNGIPKNSVLIFELELVDFK